MSREYTAEEAREHLLDSVRSIVDYWTVAPNQTDRERCEGVAFSILTLLDGCSDAPAFDLSVSPHPDDKQFHVDNGENYYADGMVINETMLHEEFFK